MNLRFYIKSFSKSFSKLFLLITVFCLFINCSKKDLPEQTVIIVKVPPIYNEQLSREENYYRFQRFLFPQLEMPNPIPKGLPNDDSVLFVSVNEKDEIELNSQKAGTVSRTDSLTSWLAHIFSEREKQSMYEPGNRRIVKVVGIKTAPSVKYGDFMKVVEAIKQSGAEPIILLFNDDTKPKPKISL